MSTFDPNGVVDDDRATSAHHNHRVVRELARVAALLWSAALLDAPLRAHRVV